MMMVQEQAANVDAASNILQKPAQAEIQWNSQGERVDAPVQVAPVSESSLQEPAPLECSYLDISLWDTPLAGPLDALHPPTDDTGLVHAIISCGHVLKSTHDLARWSEKTGARRVNSQDSIDSISNIIIGLDAPHVVPAQQANSKKLTKNVQQPSKVLSCGPVLKSTHNAASVIEKQNINSAATADLLDDVANIVQGQQRQSSQRGQRRNAVRQPRAPPVPSQVINCWSVLKSTHDAASWSEKKGPRAVNSAEAAGILDDLLSSKVAGKSLPKSKSHSQIVSSKPVLKSTHDLAINSGKNSSASVGALDLAGRGGLRVSGSSLQTGLDTQGGSHVQLEGSKGKETPEKAMQALHVHV